jgi:hypothetical protein
VCHNLLVGGFSGPSIHPMCLQAEKMRMSCECSLSVPAIEVVMPSATVPTPAYACNTPLECQINLSERSLMHM